MSQDRHGEADLPQRQGSDTGPLEAEALLEAATAMADGLDCPTDMPAPEQ